MRPLPALLVVFAVSLACGGGGALVEERPEPSLGTELGTILDAPPPPPEPEPVPAPAPSGEVLAVVGPFGGRDVAIVCTRAGSKVDCPVGPCGGDGSCEPGPEVKVVGVASLDGEGVAMGLGMASLSTFSEEFCSGTAAEVADVGERTAPREAVAVDESDPALAGVRALVASESTLAAWRLDVDGATGAEILAEASTPTGSVLFVVRDGAGPAVVYDTRREPLSDDADDFARAEYDMNGTTLTWLGVTDAELDGTLEIVVEGSGYESSWIAVLKLDGTALGSLGCAV